MMSDFIEDTQKILSKKYPWDKRTLLEKVHTGIIVLVLVSLYPLSYEFYFNLRIMMCVGLYFYFRVIWPERGNKPIWLWIIIALFIFYNPVVPLRLGERDLWWVINCITIYVLYRARMVFDLPLVVDEKKSEPDSADKS